MTRCLRHRGPDDVGVQVVGPAGLGHTRLSILDLSSAGHQPMQNEDGSVTLVYNGETYNFSALRHRLEAAGVRFRSHSDTEVVLQAFVRWGLDSFSMLDGMFALAIWDNRSETLHLVRDRFGIKPLYYATSRSGLVFGSEIKAILASGRIHPTIDWQALHEYLYYGNALGSRTLFDGVRRLLPGHRLTFNRDSCATTAYWSLADVAPVRDTVDTATETTRGLLAAAVDSHLVSDVPVGVFLSGGVDSSAITALASSRYAGRLQTFAVGFDFDGGAGELPRARAVAQHFGTDHHELHIAGADLPMVIESLVRRHDEPFGDAANIPLYLLCRQLAGSIKVVLQGDGGDEMFAGYRRHRIVSHERFWQLVSRAGGVLSSLGLRGPAVSRAHRFFKAMAHSDRGMRTALLLTPETLQLPPTHTLSLEVRGLVEALDPFARYREVARSLGHLDPLQQLLYTDIAILLPDTFLEKVDKSTMAYGIEARVPFLDAALSRYAMGLPAKLKVRRGQKKWMLRRAMRGIVPDAVLDAPKRGFAVPVDAWLRGPLRPYLESVLFDPSTLNSGLFDRSVLEAVLREHVTRRRNRGFLLYKLLNLALWHRAYIGPSRTTVCEPLGPEVAPALMP